jgi:hypothetical protein
MTTIESITTAAFEIDDAQLQRCRSLLAIAAGRLEAYRHDLRGYFQWAADNNVEVLEATRPHIDCRRCFPVRSQVHRPLCASRYWLPQR